MDYEPVDPDKRLAKAGERLTCISCGDDFDLWADTITNERDHLCQVCLQKRIRERGDKLKQVKRGK